MTLKWVSAIVAAASAGSFATANVVAGARVPAAANLALIAGTTGGIILVVLAELYQRLDARLDVLSEFLVARLDEITARLNRLEARSTLDALLAEATAPEPAPSTVVPLAPLARRPRR
jgi:hypothetical protein